MPAAPAGGTARGRPRAADGLRLRKGGVLFRAGDSPRALYQLLSGQLKVYWPVPRGRRQVLCLASPGDWLGLESFFLGQDYCMTACALEPCVLRVMDAAAVESALAGDPTWRWRMLASLSDRALSWADTRVRALRLSSTRRVAAFLLDLHAHGHAALADNELRLPAKKIEVASLLEITAESLSRALRRLTELQFIRVHGRGIVLLDPVALRRWCDAEGD